MRSISFFGASLILLLVSSASIAEPTPYVVREGDTLFRIARDQMHDPSAWKRIAVHNDLPEPYTIKIGQTLMLPDSTVTGIMAMPRAAVNPMPGSSADQDHAEVISNDQDPGAHADDPPREVIPPFIPTAIPAVSLDELLSALTAANPSLRSSRAEARAASYRPSQAGSLPDPMIRARVMNEEMQMGMVDAMGVTFQRERLTSEGLSFSQMIPLGKLAPMERVERRMAEMAGVEVEMTMAGISSRLKTAYTEVDLIDRSSATLRQIRDILTLVVSSAEAMYKVGEGRQSDVLRAQLELSMIADRLLMLEGRRGTAVAEINALLDRPAETPLEAVVPLVTYDLAGADVSLDSSPMTRIAAANASTADARVALARAQFLPDLELMAGVTNRQRFDPSWEVGVGLTLPIWGASKQIPGLREAEESRAASRERLTEARNRASRGVAAGLVMARTGRKQVLLYNTTILPQARLTLEASLASYRVSSVDFMTVVENAATLLRYALAEEEATADFYRAIAMIEEMTGRSMEWKMKEGSVVR